MSAAYPWATTVDAWDTMHDGTTLVRAHSRTFDEGGEDADRLYVWVEGRESKRHGEALSSPVLIHLENDPRGSLTLTVEDARVIHRLLGTALAAI